MAQNLEQKLEQDRERNFEPEFGVDTNRGYPSGLNNASRPIAEDEGEVEPPSDLPLHPSQLAPEPSDAGVPRAELEPRAEPIPPSWTDPNIDRELADFARFIAATREEDYGDWMRRANVYWEALRSNLLHHVGQGDRAFIEREMEQLKEQIQYRPDWKVDETQRRVVAAALELRRRLTGRDDIGLHDLEVPTSTRTPNEHSH